MRQVCTIFWDKVEGSHLTLIAEVQDNGSHVVVQSKVHINVGQDLDKVKAFWVNMLGAENVKAYMIAEYFGKDVGRY